MTQSGFEPETYCLEGSCSIQLSYWAEPEHKVHFVGVAGFEPATSCSQSRRDNRATLHPERLSLKAERQGLEPWRQSPVDRLAICSVTTPAPLLALPQIVLVYFGLAIANVMRDFRLCKCFCVFFLKKVGVLFHELNNQVNKF